MTPRAPVGASLPRQANRLRTAMSRLGEAPFLRFACVGAIGFVVDAGILTFLMRLGWQPLPARLLSFPAAVATTWLLNKAWTFSSTPQRSRRGGYVRYSGIQLVGALINLGIFTLLITVFPASRAAPWAPLAVAALVALTFNYLATRHLVFSSPNP